MMYLDDSQILEEIENGNSEDFDNCSFEDSDLEQIAPSTLGFQVLLGLPIKY